MTPDTIVDGRYRLVREIARGGAGTVFEATHEFTGQTVALKVLRPEHTANPRLQARFLREARVLHQISHPNVVEVLDAGRTPSGQTYLAMELLEGRPLGGLLTARGKLSPSDTVQIGTQIAAALSAAHAKQVIHRDVKPDNILVLYDPGSRTWRAKLLDFGSVRLEGSDEKLTKMGEILGSPEYMSPEQLMTEPLDHRADVYSLGVTLYECLTGRVPYPGTYAQVLLSISSTRCPSVYELAPEVPPELAVVVGRAISPKPDDRHPDAATLAKELSATLARAPAQPAAQPTATRRAFARAIYVTPVRLLIPGEAPSDGRSEDISERGLLVQVDRELPFGIQIRVRFAVPITGRVVEVDAFPRWTRAQRGKRVTGLELVGVPAEATKAIARYVSLMATPSQPPPR